MHNALSNVADFAHQVNLVLNVLSVVYKHTLTSTYGIYRKHKWLYKK
jgi:hypothetical protein